MLGYISIDGSPNASHLHLLCDIVAIATKWKIMLLDLKLIANSHVYCSIWSTVLLEIPLEKVLEIAVMTDVIHFTDEDEVLDLIVLFCL